MSTEARRAPSSAADESEGSSARTTEPSVFTPRARVEKKPPVAVPAPDAPASPPPPPASARFPDAPPAARRAVGEGDAKASGAVAPNVPVTSPRPAETPEESTTRLRPVRSAPTAAEASTPVRDRGVTDVPRVDTTVPGSRTAWTPAAPTTPLLGSPPPAPDPAYSWSAGAPTWSLGTFGEPEPFDGTRVSGPMAWARGRVVGAAVCVVLGLGLIGGAAVGSWLSGDEGAPAPASAYEAAGGLWHSVPVDKLFPPTVDGKGAGPGGADRTWTRIAVAPDSGCADAFDPLLRKALAPVGCRRLLRATYTDATQSYVTTVGLLFTKADPAAMTSLANRFRSEHLDRRTDLLPRPYAAKGTAAAAFGDAQRASWTIDVLTDAPVVAFAVSGWADGRTVDTPEPAAQAVRAGATSAPAQAGLGNEAQGLADRVERRLRQRVGPATEKPA